MDTCSSVFKADALGVDGNITCPTLEIVHLRFISLKYRGIQSLQRHGSQRYPVVGRTTGFVSQKSAERGMPVPNTSQSRSLPISPINLRSYLIVSINTSRKNFWYSLTP